MGSYVKRGQMTNIQVEDVSDIKKKIVVEVPSQTVTEMLDAEYRDLKKNVQINWKTPSYQTPNQLYPKSE